MDNKEEGLYPVIAIDGPSASGKGTLARRLAEHFGFAWLDTGLLYRAVGLAVLRAGKDPSDAAAAQAAAEALDPVAVTKGVDREALRSDEASMAASKVAAIPAVRAALLKFQRDFCLTPPEGKKGAVLDGRDIGTVVAPDATVKLFITAGAETRAARRFKELQERGQDATYAAVLADMQARDARDAERALAPTKPARDAVIVDTTSLDADQAFEACVGIASKALATGA
ncbi:MAG: (d)CMP kinase [Alphaproteobacteria bacterium]|nr:(d)CMP kinase [Alphaproteobacteria bacterium]